MSNTYWKSGEWNAVCDICGIVRKSSELIPRWDGMMACKPVVNPGCWETRHPQDFVKPPRVEQPIAWTRPEGEDVETLVCTMNGLQGVAGYGSAGCMRVGYTLGYFN